MSVAASAIRISIHLRGGAEPILADNWPASWKVRETQEYLREKHHFTGGVIELNGGPLHLDQTFAEQMANIEGENVFTFVNGEKEF